MDFKFPHTPHLAWLGPNPPRADKIFSPGEVDDFLSLPIVVEEKLDGANIGIFFENGNDSPVVKNRNTVLGARSHPQFQPLWPWLAAQQPILYQAMGTRLALFGEWCFALHSIHYRNLPAYFNAFDVYDRQAEKFWSVVRRDRWAREFGLATVPVVARGTYSLKDLRRLLLNLPSRFGGDPAEGIYLRQDEPNWLCQRAKLVRPEFVQAIEEHWSKRSLERNTLGL